MKGRKGVRVYVSKGKPITGMMTGRKEAGNKGTGKKLEKEAECKEAVWCNIVTHLQETQH